jgi:hypothetical protein
MLLHDDDLLMPDAVELLFSCFVKYPQIDAAFGKQYIITDLGVIDETGSNTLNRDYYRTSEFEGLKLSPLETGFLQQFPNDAYLIRSGKARGIGYLEDAGDACDFDFALRLGLKNLRPFFLNEYTAKYRLSNDAINKKSNNNAGVSSYKLVEKLNVPLESRRLRANWLKAKAPIAISEALNIGMYTEATRIYFSHWHRNRIFSLGGMKRFLKLVMFPIIRPARKDWH